MILAQTPTAATNRGGWGGAHFHGLVRLYAAQVLRDDVGHALDREERCRLPTVLAHRPLEMHPARGERGWVGGSKRGVSADRLLSSRREGGQVPADPALRRPPSRRK